MLAGHTLLSQINTQLKPGNTVFVGEPYILTLSVAEEDNVQWPFVKDTLQKNLEILKTDTIVQDGNCQFIMSIITFDTGSYYIPSLPVIVAGDTSYSDSLQINVRLMEVDTSQAPKDIKPIYDAVGKDVSDSQETWISKNWPWLLASAILLAMTLMFIFYKKKKTKTSPPPLPPNLEARKKLEELRISQPWLQGKHKQFHTELSDILRTYIQNEFGVQAHEQTTGELVKNLRQELRNREALNILKQVLSLSDLAKFAKYTPVTDENEQALDSALKFVIITEPDNEPIDNNKEL
jgi:hypothetical protein